MVFDWANVGTPFSWYFVTAVFAGAAVARILRRDRRRESWTLVYLYLSVSIASASAGILVPGLERFLDPRVAYFSAGVVVASYFAFRYRIAIGVPVLLIVVVVVTFFGISLRGWLPLNGNSADVAAVQVLGTGGGRIDLETTPLGGEQAGSTVTGTLPAGPVAPVVEALKFSPCYFFLSSAVLYRFDGLIAGEAGTTRPELSLPRTVSTSAAIVAGFPGTQRHIIVGKAIDLVMLQKYRVRLSSDLVAELVPGSR